MGEYAKRQDGQEIKIGTCESMYYLRYEDRDKVRKLPGNLDPSTTTNLFWRLPFPDEDNIRIGEYTEYNRGLRLFKKNEDTGYYDSFSDSETVEHPGTMQCCNDSGLLINVKCYHGERLPTGNDDFKAHWNGKSWFYELVSIKNTPDGIFPVVHCRHCRSMWRYSWDDVLPFIHDEEMKRRLLKYVPEPQHNSQNAEGGFYDIHTGSYHNSPSPE